MFRQVSSTAVTALGVIGVSTLLSVITPASAAPVAHPAAVYGLAAQAISLQQAVEQVKQQYGGRVLKAEPVRVKGRAGYRIRVMNDGRIREFIVDASNGELIRP